MNISINYFLFLILFILAILGITISIVGLIYFGIKSIKDRKKIN